MLRILIITVKVAQGFLNIVLWSYPSPGPTLIYTITHLQNNKEAATRLPLGTISLGADVMRWQYIYCLLQSYLVTYQQGCDLAYQHEAWCQR